MRSVITTVMVNPTFNHKSVLRMLGAGVCLVMIFLAVGLADELHLKDGRVIEADEVWEVGEIVWYKQGKMIASVAKADVVRITKPKPAGTKGAVEADKPASAESKAISKIPAPVADTNSGVIDKSVRGEQSTHKITRLLLKDGTRIDADSIWEESERIAYRLGKMQTFVDRSEVVKVVREIEVADDPVLPTDVKLRFTTGNRGLDNLIVYYASRYGVDPLLIYLVMREESGFNYRAVSRVGARGLMQLMPATAARLGVRNIHDPVENVDAGTRYLRNLIDMFSGDINLALAAYNAGEGAVLKYGRRIPPYTETVNYVWRINTAYRRAVGQ